MRRAVKAKPSTFILKSRDDACFLQANPTIGHRILSTTFRFLKKTLAPTKKDICVHFFLVIGPSCLPSRVHFGQRPKLFTDQKFLAEQPSWSGARNRRVCLEDAKRDKGHVHPSRGDWGQ